jgi:hypothetical protein
LKNSKQRFGLPVDYTQTVGRSRGPEAERDELHGLNGTEAIIYSKACFSELSNAQ